MIFAAVRGLEITFGQLIGENAARNLLDVLPQGATGQAVVLLAMVPLLAKLYAEPTEGALAVAAAQPKIEFLKLLKDEVPMLKEDGTLTPQRLKMSSHNAALLDRLLSEAQNIAKYEPCQVTPRFPKLSDSNSPAPGV